MKSYWTVFLIGVVLLSIGVDADDRMLSQTNLRGSSLSALPPRHVLEEMANASGDDDDVAGHEANSRQRKQDLFQARSNDFDDDVIAAYESSNDESSFAQMVPFRTSTPIDGLPSNTSSSIDDNESTSAGIFHQAPAHPADPNLSFIEHPHLASTAVTPTNDPLTATTAELSTLDPLENDLTPSHAPSSQPEYNDNTVVIARYHQEDIIAEANTDEQLQGGAGSTEELLPPSQSEQDLGSLSPTGNKKSKQIVPALLTGFASMVLFFALFLVCANQREQYIQRKWEQEQIRRAALTDDGSCGRSVRSSSSQAYSEAFDDVYGDAVEDGRSLYSRSSAKRGDSSDGGGSYWVQAVVKKIADRNRNDEAKHHHTNILPPLDGDENSGADDDESSFAGLSLVSSLTQSLMTFGSALWPSEEASLDLGPSSRRVAAQSKRSSVASSEKESLDGEDSAIAHLHQTNSNEDAGGSVCSSLTDGTSTTLKSEEFEEAPGGRGSHNGACMPAIDEDGVHDEETRRMSLYSPSTRKDISTDSTQTQSTILDDSSSLDLASELARLQNLIGSIDPGNDFYERDMVFKSLSEESFDLGRTEGREEI